MTNDSHFPRRRMRRRTAVLAAAAALACAVVGAAALYALGSRERGVGFRYDRTVGPYRVRQLIARQTGIQDVRVCRCAPTSEVRLKLPEGLETTASIYDRGGSDRRPGIVFLHGNTWLGRNLSTYRILASLLAARGFIVLTYDQFGFGESDDPFGRGPGAVAAAYGFGATNAAIDYLLSNTPVDPGRIVILGHSGGVEPAISIGFARPEIAGIAVMVAPPPPGGTGPPGSQEYKEERSSYFSQRFLDTYRFVYGREVPDWFQWDMTKMEEVYAEFRKGYEILRIPGHKPILLLLGERDQPSGHEHVRRDFELWANPKELIVLKRADHYLNAAQSLGLVFYDRIVARQVSAEVVPWLLTAVAGDSGDTRSAASKPLP